jgi:putative sensory transduction regulator
VSAVAAIDVVDTYLEALPGASRRLAHGEWGVTLEPDRAGGWPLDVGIAIQDGLLRAQAHALTSPEHVDPWMLLWWNRQTRHVRFGCTQDREVWVHADLPVGAVDEQQVDRLLGLVVEGAIAVREYQRARANPEPAAEAGWLPGDA